MQVRDLIEQLQRFDPRDEVRVGIPFTDRSCPECQAPLKRFGTNELEVDQVIREYGNTVIKVVE